MANEDSVLSFRIASEDVEEIRKLIDRGYYSTISEFAMGSIRSYLRDMHIFIAAIYNEHLTLNCEFDSYLKTRIDEIISNECPMKPNKAVSRAKGMQVLLTVTDEVKNALVEVDKVTLGLKSYQKIGMFGVYWNICRAYSLFSLMDENQETINEIIKKKDLESYDVPDRYRGKKSFVWKRVEE